MAFGVFGLTGGIGSGKSSVAQIWRAHGLPVVDADVLARQAVAAGSETLAAIAARFGADLIGDDGQLQRARLAERVFGDTQAISALNAIVHPEVRRLSQLAFAELAAAGHALGCYEVPLLFETGLDQVLRPIVVVSCSLDVQIERAMKRDGASEASVQRRLQAQLPLAEKVARADFVIDNSGTLAELEVAALAALRNVCAAVGSSADVYELG